MLRSPIYSIDPYVEDAQPVTCVAPRSLPNAADTVTCVAEFGFGAKEIAKLRQTKTVGRIQENTSPGGAMGIDANMQLKARLNSN